MTSTTTNPTRAQAQVSGPGDITDSPVYGPAYHDGKDNVFRNNLSYNNDLHGYKFMWGPQDFDDSTQSNGDRGQKYYYASGVAPFVKDSSRPGP